MKRKWYSWWIFGPFEIRDNVHKFARVSKNVYAYKRPYDADPSRPERKHTFSSFSAILINFICVIQNTKRKAKKQERSKAL